MSTTLLSAFYDIDFLCKQTEKSLNNLNLNMLDKKAVGTPVTSPSSSFVPGFLRRHSTSNLPALANNNTAASKFPGNSFCHLKEGSVSTALLNKENKFRDRSFSENGERSQHLLQLQQQQQQQKPGAQINSTRYKTELCRPFEESGTCKYGEKCQFAHGFHELRSLTRHPKYKTELCRTFHTIGFCPYGPRCHFIHNAEERRPAPAGGDPRGPVVTTAAFAPGRDGLQLNFGPREGRPKLHHSLSFSGFSSQHHGLDSPLLLESPTSRTPPPSSSSSSSSGLYCEELLSPAALSCANNAFTFSGQELGGLIAPLAIQTQNFQPTTTTAAAYYRGQPPSPPPPPSTTTTSNFTFQPLRRLSESPVFDAPPSPPDSLSDRESYLSGSLSSGSLSGSESPSLDSGRRLPIFSRLSISDD
ncbi:mRNA decay activator protein ZFP36L2 [Rhinatrema bivittatum]|uniref:mRNA decay activator protein ZFP36L2 n=1 Tax=Rhinatrema bivittatum TaxID=194408 RepID=UPI001127D7EA|nr:mRNA decay activator protein ZFP36L2 [Rhinatrema bivittatum]